MRLATASLLCAGLVAAALHVRADGPPATTPEVAAALARIGTWDGVTPTAELAGPYEDRLQQEIPFGRRSFYLTPWRAYMDTQPAARFLECLGVNLQCDPREAEAVAQVLAEAGIRSARVEFGWGGFTYENPGQMNPSGAANAARVLKVLQKHGIRPILLLNAHHGFPCPLKNARYTLAAAAAVGDRALILKTTDGLVPGYSGPNGLTDYKAAEVIITKVDKASGRCELSKPLPKALVAGQEIEIATLRYQPFAGAVFADGTPNPAAQETLDGWMKYVAGICALAKQALGTDAAPDCGFDLEVWNEYTFGSHFLDDRNYYEPPRQYKEPVRYARHGRTAQGVEAILPMTVDYANDPANRLPGVNVFSGFANQRPWENGTDMWPGQAGFSRHYYTGIDLKPITPATAPYPNSGPLNALGAADGKPDGKDWHTVVPGSYFIPTLIVSMPERWHYAYQTEFMTRDVQPFPGPWKTHHRFSHPGGGRPAQVWMTEFNFDRSAWAQELMKATGCKPEDSRLIRLVQHVAAKATLRTFVFQSHKGIYTIDLFAVKGGDLSLGLLPDAFFKTLAEDKYQLTDKGRAETGPQLEVLGRVTKLMRTGQSIAAPRKLTVARLVEHQPRLAFQGDGTPAHPDRFHRDDFACLPFQLAAGKFAIAYYVVTRNLVHDWDPARDALEPTRYDMPPQTFDLTLDNVRGRGPKFAFWDRARVSVWDPITDTAVPVETLAATATSITVRLATVDYPRFLIIDEGAPGPLIQAPKIVSGEGGKVIVSFTTSLSCRPSVTWGPLPGRTGTAPAGALPAGTSHRLELPALPPNCGVRISLEVDGLKESWPLWDYDVQGVLEWTAPDRK